MIAAIVLWAVLSLATGRQEGVLIVDDAQDRCDIEVRGALVARGNTAAIPAALERLGLTMGTKIRR